MKILKLLFAISICGTGHILNRKHFRGLLLFTGFLASCFLVYFGLLSQGSTSLLFALTGFVSAILIWVYSIIDFCSDNNTKKKKVKINSDFNKKYIEGISLYLQGQYEKAITCFISILKKNKRDPDIYYYLSKIYLKKGDKKQSKKMCKKYFLFDVSNKWKREELKK